MQCTDKPPGPAAVYLELTERKTDKQNNKRQIVNNESFGQMNDLSFGLNGAQRHVNTNLGFRAAYEGYWILKYGWLKESEG